MFVNISKKFEFGYFSNVYIVTLDLFLTQNIT